MIWLGKIPAYRDDYERSTGLATLCLKEETVLQLRDFTTTAAVRAELREAIRSVASSAQASR